MNNSSTKKTNRERLDPLLVKQGNKCFYCGCEMNEIRNHPQSATLEHLNDKWSTRKHNKNSSPSNLVAACYHCNHTRGSKRNQIAREYYKSMAMKKGIKISVSATKSKKLYSLFGPVPQHIFNKQGVK